MSVHDIGVGSFDTLGAALQRKSKQSRTPGVLQRRLPTETAPPPEGAGAEKRSQVLALLQDLGQKGATQAKGCDLQNMVQSMQSMLRNFLDQSGLSNLQTGCALASWESFVSQVQRLESNSQEQAREQAQEQLVEVFDDLVSSLRLTLQKPGAVEGEAAVDLEMKDLLQDMRQAVDSTYRDSKPEAEAKGYQRSLDTYATVRGVGDPPEEEKEHIDAVA